MAQRQTSGPRRPKPAGIIKIYAPLFRGERRAITFLSVLSFLGGVSEAMLLVVVARIAFAIGGDAGSVGGLGPLGRIDLSTSTLFWVALVLGMFRTAASVGAAHFTAAMTARRTSVLRADTYADYATASWSRQSAMDEAAVQDLLLRHVSKVIGALSITTGGMPSALSLVAMVLSAVLVDPVSAALVVFSGAVLFFGLRPLSAMAKRHAGAQREAGRRYIERSGEVIALSLEIRAFGVTREVADDLAEMCAEEARPIYVNTFLNRLVSALYQFAAIAIVLFGLLSVYLFLNRPLASLSAIVVILVRALNQASTLQSTYHNVVEAAPFAERLTEVREEFRASEPMSGTAELPLRPELHFEDVSYRYGPQTPLALDRVTFSVAAGEAVGVIGPSGSGKSTLIQILLRLRDPTSGRFTLGAVDSTTLDDDAWFRQVAFVPQDSRVLNATVADNIAFFRPYVTRDDVVAAAKQAHVHEEIMGMPQGYDTVLGSRGGSLSGGQRQRVSLARALASDPHIVVLDEPTSALDMRSESLVHKTLTEMQGSVTLLVIAHRLSTLRTCDRIMVLGDGRLQAFGSRLELEETSPFYRDAISLSKLRS